MRADRKAIIGKLLLKPLDWLTLSPAVLGATLGMGAWAVDMNSGYVLATAAILGLVSTGIYLQRLLLGWDHNYEATIADWLKDAEKKRDEDLDRLYRELAEDGDPRTEILLKDLRTLTKALLSEQADSANAGTLDVLSDVSKLFQRSVDYLKESLELWRMASEMERKSIRQRLLQHREMLITEVEKSLENLGEVLAGMKRASINSHDGRQLAELRDDLASRLRIAEEVEKRMQNLRSERMHEDDEEKYLKYAKES